METIYYIEYLRGKNWKRTYFGNEVKNNIFFFKTFDEAKNEIINMHQYQKDNNKKLTRYRIIEKIYKTETLLELP